MKRIPRPKPTEQDKEPQFCCDCEHGTFDTKFENLSLDGEPTLISCPYSTRKRVVNEVGCSYFKRKTICLIDTKGAIG